MPLLKELFGPQIDRIQQSMTLTAERHAMLAQNLANVNTPNYRRKDMDFNLVLESEMEGPARVREIQRRMSGDKPTAPNQANANGPGNDVDLETEVMAIAETELRYQALSDFASAHFSNLRNVIREGR